MITVEHLTKCYGDFMAVNDLSFEIEEGHVYGFLGPNGAGKSTTMNIMTGCLSATEGCVRIEGYDIFEEPNKAKRLIGYLPEQPPLYMNETPMEYLKFVGEAKGLKGQELRDQIDEVVEQTGIEEVKHKLISKLSKGYKQRVGIAQALLGNPKVIILDEPTVGLDPIQIIEIRDLIKQLGEEHTVILSSHILTEVQTICEKILIINKGKLIAFDDTQNLEQSLLSTNHEITFVTEAEEEQIEAMLTDIEHILEWKAEDDKNGNNLVTIQTDCDDANDVCRALFLAFAKQEKTILQMNVKKASLEEVFIELTEKDSQEMNIVTDEEVECEDEISEIDEIVEQDEEKEVEEE